MSRRIRRVVTGFNKEGESVVLSDERIHDRGAIFEIWGTRKSPADTSSSDYTAENALKLEPPAGGTIFRLVQIEPLDPSIPDEQVERTLAEGYAQLSASHCRHDTTRSPWMHRTKTIDYVVVLKGRPTLLLENDEVQLKPFDVVIQRATNHAWINRGPGLVLMAAVLVDCESPREWNEQITEAQVGRQ